MLDTEWKRIDQALGNSTEKYGLSQSDFYQLYAHGQRYPDGAGNGFLVDPQTATFDTPLSAFVFSDQLRLWVVPFDLEAGQMHECCIRRCESLNASVSYRDAVNLR